MLRAVFFSCNYFPLDKAVLVAGRALQEQYEDQVQVDFADPSPWSPASATPKRWDACVFNGLRGVILQAANYYHEHGLQVLVIDVPRIPVEGQWRVGPRDLSWLPPGPVPTDRIDALDVKFRSPRRRTKGKKVLVLGQTRGDGQHGLSDPELQSWAEETVKTVKMVSESSVIWRPHPKDVWEVEAADENVDPSEVSLEECFDQSYAVVTLNSTAGLDALAAGLPVVATMSSVYSELSGSLEAWSKLAHPGVDAVRDLFARIAYSQWTMEEIETGEALARLLGLEKGQEPLVEASPEPEVSELEEAEPEPEDELAAPDPNEIPFVAEIMEDDSPDGHPAA